ncbi:unnamed protein product, partial [Didymodactylos carnosus]
TKPTVELTSSQSNENILISYYSVWSALWKNVTDEYLEYSDKIKLRKVSLDSDSRSSQRSSVRENDKVLDEICKQQQNLRKTKYTASSTLAAVPTLHDRLMADIKRNHILRPVDVNQPLAALPSKKKLQRKRIRPVDSQMTDSDDSEEERRDIYGRKRVAVVDCLLESSDEEVKPKPKVVTGSKSERNVSQYDDDDDDDYVDLAESLATLEVEYDTEWSASVGQTKEKGL